MKLWAYFQEKYHKYAHLEPLKFIAHGHIFDYGNKYNGLTMPDGALS